MLALWELRCKYFWLQYNHATFLFRICLHYIAYDPNYNYDDADEEEMECDSEVTF